MQRAALDHQIWDALTECGEELLNRHEGSRAQEAVECFRKAASICTQGVGDAPYTLGGLARAYLARFSQTGHRADVDNAILSLRAALTRTPPGHSQRSSTLNSLATDLITRYKQFGDIADLDEAITLFTSALELTPPGHPDRPSVLNNFANVLGTRYERTGDTTDLEKAIINHESTLELTPQGHPDRSSTLTNYAIALTSRFEKVGDRADLEKGIKNHQEALGLRPSGHPLRSSSLNKLGELLLVRFEQIGDRGDLHDSVVYHTEALELQPPDHPLRHSTLQGMANVLLVRFEQVGNQSDLDEAIVYGRRALEMVPPGHLQRMAILQNFANALSTRFEHIGDLADLDEAIIYYRRALELAPPGHTQRSGSLTSVADALMARFYEVGDRLSLDEAITCFSNACELTQPGHLLHSLTLGNLGCALLSRYEQIGDRSDLDRSIVIHKSTLEGRPLGQSERSSNLNNLANSLRIRFERFGDPADSTRAIAGYRGALELRPPGHYLRTSSLVQLANALLICSARNKMHDTPTQSFPTGHTSDHRPEILELLQDASVTTGGPPSECLRAALLWADLAYSWSDPSALQAYRTAMELLEILVSIGGSLESRHERITSAKLNFSHRLAVDAAACALDAGQVEVAVELLEQGRSVLLTQAGRYRTPVDDFEVTHPELAGEFRRTGAEMQRFVMSSPIHAMRDLSRPQIDDAVAIYQQSCRRWTEIIERIRSTDGLSTFLRPSPFSLLRTAAADGPIIIVNLSLYRTDAIILRSDDDPCLVALPDAKPEFIARLSEKANHKTNTKEFKALLCDLWQVIVHPILKVLRDQMQLPPGSRVWWCPTGATAHLPLHAAGDYSVPKHNLPDIFVSSYTSTLSALIRARQRSSPESSTIPNILAVGLSETPGQAKLPSVALEIRSVKALAKHVSVLNGPDAKTDAVLRAMNLHPWIHLAGHGHVDQIKPFQSSFLLHDRSLTLLEITKQILPQADLAFLSACHSAAGSVDRPDEALHLTAGMQFAGYRRVLGTLWALCDLDGPQVAGTFYSSLLGAGERAVAKSSAHALDRAVAELRSQGVTYSRWTCFVHYGC